MDVLSVRSAVQIALVDGVEMSGGVRYPVHQPRGRLLPVESKVALWFLSRAVVGRLYASIVGGVAKIATRWRRTDITRFLWVRT